MRRSEPGMTPEVAIVASRGPGRRVWDVRQQRVHTKTPTHKLNGNTPKESQVAHQSRQVGCKCGRCSQLQDFGGRHRGWRCYRGQGFEPHLDCYTFTQRDRLAHPEFAQEEMMMLPPKSPEPTAVGAVSSAVAVHASSGGGSAFFVAT